MAIQPPRLDDRSWQDLRDELVRRIPVHAPESVSYTHLTLPTNREV